MTVSRSLLLTCVTFLSVTPVFAQDMPAGNTRTETRLSGIEEQMRVLNGRVEQIEYMARHPDQTLQRIQTDNDARLSKLESTLATLPPPQPAPPPPSPPVPAPPQTPTAAQPQSAQPQPTQPAAPDSGLTPAEQYEHAFTLLRQANYTEAETGFKTFIDKNPKDKLIDNAKYWYAETLYVRARFDEAAIAFADAYQQNTRGTKAPDSLLKLGMSLGALNKTADACTTLSELKTKYPDAAPTIKSRADDERLRLKCLTH